MSVTTATRTAVAVRDFTEQEMRRYFDKPPIWPIVVAILGALFVLIGLATLQNSGAGCAFVGLLVLAVGALGYYFTALQPKPTDEEYDAWVARKTGRLEPEARKALSLVDNSQIVGQILRVDGVVLPTVANFASYGDVRFKEGKDGITRFSINTVKFFYPEQHKIAAYSDVVNALNQGMHRAKTDEFFYSQIVGVKTEDQSQSVVVDRKSGHPVTVTVSAKTFMLISSAGYTTGETVAVASVNSSGNRKFYRPGAAVDQTVAALRKLLDDKTGGAAQAQQNFQEQQAKMQADMQQRMLEMQQQMLEQMQRMQQGGSVPPAPPTDDGTGS